MSAEESGLTRQLTRQIAGRQITRADLERASYYVLDAVANSIAGRNTREGKILAEFSRDIGGEAGTTNKDIGRLAFLRGASAHILECDDLHRASVLHPGCVIVPAIWALTDAQNNYSSKLLLKAVLRGYEVAIRIAMAAGLKHYEIWHMTATVGPFGAAMAAGVLLDLDEDQMVHALGNAGTQSAGFWQFLNEGAMSKHLHAGHAAEAGVVAAMLAARGFTGASAILEGCQGFFAASCPDADPSALFSSPHDPWQLNATSLKPWPCCRHTHAAIDAAIGLRREIVSRKKDITEISSVAISCTRVALDVCDRPQPENNYQAKFSLQHCVAAALARDIIDFEAFDEGSRSDLAPLRAKINLVCDDRLNRLYPDHWGAKIRLEFVDGEILHMKRDDALGDPETPLTTSDMREKAKILLEYGNIADPDKIIDAVLDMAHGGVGVFETVDNLSAY